MSNTIDVFQIARSRKGGEKIPAFVLRAVAGFIHQDFLNEFFVKGYEGEVFAHECIKHLDIKVDVSGLDNLSLIPEETHCTFVSNHPLGGIDGVALLDILLPRYDGKVRMLVNDFLLNIKGLAPLCIGVNKMGGQAKSLLGAVHDAFDSENEMLIFPAGQCSRKYNGKIQDCAWSKTFVKESIRTGRYIVPIHFIAKNSRRFYFVDRICRLFHIKLNIPMFMLPDELYRGQHRTVKVVIGKPIDPKALDNSKSALEWAQVIREEVYSL